MNNPALQDFFMDKIGRIVLLVVAFLAMTAATNNVAAGELTNIDLQKVNLSSSTFVSKKKPIVKKPKTEPKKEVLAINYAVPTQTIPATIQIQEPTATPSPAPVAASLDAGKIFDMVNSYRTSQGRVAFERANDEIQQLANVRATELIAEGANGSIHAGLYNRNLPYWIWENAKYGSDEAGTVAWWINSWLHRSSILGDYKYSAVACHGNYCVQLFTSLVAK